VLLRRVAILVLLLEDEGLGRFIALEFSGALVRASLDALLCVVPGAARVGEAEGDLDAADDDAGEQAVQSILAE